ncbi:MAG: hypothetical protein PHO89_01130 [Methylacidiphilaceae bacterium]|nr:hypothetical protein [Candidatus Methylacidiphilaceae bacterium]
MKEWRPIGVKGRVWFLPGAARTLCLPWSQFYGAECSLGESGGEELLSLNFYGGFKVDLTGAQLDKLAERLIFDEGGVVEPSPGQGWTVSSITWSQT